MMIEHILTAFTEVLAPWNFMLLCIGVLAGIVAGAIPGFTITMAVVLVLPFTFGLSPIEGLSTMLGVMVGGLSGSLISAMLIGIPGTPAAVATTFDGLPMVRSGRPGLALGLGVWSSFFGGLIGAVLLMTIAPNLAQIGLEFGPWGYFSMIIFALTITASLSGKNLTKGLIAGTIGLLAASVGEDRISGVLRLNFGFDALESGFSYLPVLVGIFAFSQLMGDIRDPKRACEPLMDRKASAIRVEHRRAIGIVLRNWINLIRSSCIGVFVGVLPAAGASISNILAYDQAKKASKTPERFGTGFEPGIVAPESANNATAGGSLAIMMALGIPGDAVTAVMLGALLIHDIVPSPTFIVEKPVLAYSVLVAFFLAHFVMIVLQSVGTRIFLQCVRLRLYILAAVVLGYCAIGMFALNNVVIDMWTMFWFGILGYLMQRLGFPLVPVILGVVLGNIAEVNLNRAVSTDPNLMLFLTRPWSLFFLILAVFSAVFPWYQAARRDRSWTLWFLPLFCIGCGGPLFLMDGWLRPAVGALLVCTGIYLVWRRSRTGWQLPSGGPEFSTAEDL